MITDGTFDEEHPALTKVRVCRASLPDGWRDSRWYSYIARDLKNGVGMARSELPDATAQEEVVDAMEGVEEAEETEMATDAERDSEEEERRVRNNELARVRAEEERAVATREEMERAEVVRAKVTKVKS